ncbi:DUF1149 family protein [Enterococcus nangangensis]
MEIKRQKELVEHFHYDFKLPEQEAETELKVGFAPLKPTENYPKENTILGARLEFKIVFPKFILSGSVSQLNHLVNRKVETQTDLTQEEINEIARPLFKIVERMSYEVTEIALDQPGVKLNFAKQTTEAPLDPQEK